MSEPDQPADLPVGTVLDGAYRLDRVIFEGGMGTVYEGLQLRLNKRVAIKVMVPELAANAEALARFRREVEVTSQLAHPNVIQLLDFGAAPSGQPYLVMEYLEGEDLEHRLLRVKRLPLPAVVDIVKQAASALAATHAKGIVHRDLKPANIFLLPIEGGVDFVKVVDFGISKVRTAKTKLTRAFTMVGTPEYMSPEQATGRVDDVDHRSDQWAVSCMVWRMLSGSMPFPGGSLQELLENVVQKDPSSLIAAAPDLPSEVESVLRRALAKRQDDRFPTITAFARALETAAATAAAAAAPRPPAPTKAKVEPQLRPGAMRDVGSVMTSAPGPRRRRGSGWMVLVGLVVLAALGVGYYYRQTIVEEIAPAATPPTRPEARPPAAKRPGAPARSRSRSPGSDDR
jgi:serine/threonine-protein kinase